MTVLSLPFSKAPVATLELEWRWHTVGTQQVLAA